MYDIIVYINENAGGFMALYTRLKDLREDKELKQSEIADMLKISQQHYSLIETGKIETTFDKIIGDNMGSLSKRTCHKSCKMDRKSMDKLHL